MGTLGEYEFKVPSGTDEDVLYNVNIEEQHCDCYVGRTKQPCKHKAVVRRTFKIKNFEVLHGKNTIMRSYIQPPNISLGHLSFELRLQT